MAGRSWGQQVGRILGSALKAGAESAMRSMTKRSSSSPSPTSRTTAQSRSTQRRPTQSPSSDRSTESRDLSDFDGTPVMEYAPLADGRPDPGEIVWAWVPYEEDHSQGKDRPVLVIGHDRADPGLLLALMLTSKDHDRDAAQEARNGRHWIDIGAGDWDRERRPSEIRVDRILRIDPATVRRQGAVLDRKVFTQVATEVTRVHKLRR